MTANEAHEYTLGVVDELRQAGIVVEIRPWKTKDPNYEGQVLSKYGGPERASRNCWCRVNLKPATTEQKNLVHQCAKKLGWMGISFDTGGGACGRDWELDWSFKYLEQNIDDKAQEARDLCEDFIRDVIEAKTYEGSVRQTEK